MGQLTYTTQEVQDRLDAAGSMVRPNILDNAYFVGGGSQQGLGRFPINQRGATSASSSGFFIDRWYKANSTGTISISGTGLNVVGTGTYWAIVDQHIEITNDLLGEKVTLSFLTTSGLGYVTATLNNTLPSSDTKWFGTSAVGNVVAEIRANASYISARLASQSATPATILAIKLELGDTQTLAHWDETTQAWVLNEKPNYQQELAKCQRFCYVWNTGGSEYASIGIGYTTSATEGRVVVPFPVTMRTNPTLTTTGSFSVGVGSNVYAVSSVAKEPTWSNTDGARLNLTLSSSATSGSPCIVRGNGSTAKLIFSAEL